MHQMLKGPLIKKERNVRERVRRERKLLIGKKIKGVLEVIGKEKRRANALVSAEKRTLLTCSTNGAQSLAHQSLLRQ